MNAARPSTDTAQALATAAALRELAGRLKRRLHEKAGVEGLSLSQLSVIGHLARDGAATVTALARAEHVRPQSMGATVATLQAAGLVQGSPDPDDGRCTLISLTDKARETLRISRAAREDWLFRTIRARFTAEEQDTLARGVELLARLVES